MPATPTFELIEGSQLDASSDGTRKTTRGIITGIDVLSDPDPEVLWRALAACSSGGYGLNQPLAGHPDLVNRRILLRGFTTNGAIVDIMSESINFGSSNPTALIISRRSYLSSRTSNTFVAFGGSRLPIAVDAFNDPKYGMVPPDYASITYLHPMKSISVSGLMLGPPPDNFDAVFGMVNDAPWQGLDKGFWLAVEANTEESRYTNYWTFRRSAISRVTINWAETAILRNELIGKYVQLSEGDQQFLANLPYGNLLFKNVRGGASVVGPYPVGNFTAGFGV